MDSLNPLPPFSPEVASFLVAMRPTEIETTSSIVVEDVDHPRVEDFSESLTVSEMNRERQDGRLLKGHPIMEDFSESSIISDVDRERQEFEESLDDRLLKEANEALEKKRQWFQNRMQEVNEICRRKLELEQINHQKRIKQNQESIRLEELRKLVCN